MLGLIVKEMGERDGLLDGEELTEKLQKDVVYSVFSEGTSEKIKRQIGELGDMELLGKLLSKEYA